MVMIANYQYGWTFFVPDIQKKFGWDRASIQLAFTLFVLFETWLVPIEGWFVDKYGPRLVVLVGGILCAIGWMINAEATTLNGYYLGMIVGGIGAGAVYGTCVGNALKWFPDKRGLAAGITAAGFGAGSALTVAPIQAMIKDSGFQSRRSFIFGIGQGIHHRSSSHSSCSRRKRGKCRPPQKRQHFPDPARLSAGRGASGNPIFWLMYFDVRDGRRRRLDGHRQSQADRRRLEDRQRPGDADGDDDDGGDLRGHARPYPQRPDRPFFGWVSDMIGRENTMFIAFGIEGLGIWALYMLGHDPVVVRVLSASVFFAWGEIYSLFPSTCTDTFGAKFATTNAGLLYTAKGTAALLVPVANYMHQSVRDRWDAVFLIARAPTSSLRCSR